MSLYPVRAGRQHKPPFSMKLRCLCTSSHICHELRFYHYDGPYRYDFVSKDQKITKNFRSSRGLSEAGKRKLCSNISAVDLPLHTCIY